MVGDDDWWSSHWNTAPAELNDFLASDGISLKDAAVADFGCGDGIMAAGLGNLGAASVVGFDLDPTDRKLLEDEARSRGCDLSGFNLEFRTAIPGSLPAGDGEFDLGVSWSVMEHVFDREGFMSEARRVIKPFGQFFVQVWPLWHSEHGHHLWQWLQRFDHLRYGRDDLVRKLHGLDRLPLTLSGEGEAPRLDDHLRAIRTDRKDWMAEVLASYDSCNRITLEEIQTLLLEHGFGIGRVELMTSAFHVPADLQSVPLTRLAVSGFKLIAYRKP